MSLLTELKFVLAVNYKDVEPLELGEIAAKIVELPFVK
jgi:hypothetical protein